LRGLLRHQPDQNSWPHQLTMARLVARALATGRSALIQVSGVQGIDAYRLSYLFPALSWPQPVILCVPPVIQRGLLNIDLPRLQELAGFSKPILVGNAWPGPDWAGVLLVDPAVFLKDQLCQDAKPLPSHIPIIFDQVHELETWSRQALAYKIEPGEWQRLREQEEPLASDVLEFTIAATRYLFVGKSPEQRLDNTLEAQLQQLLAPLDYPPWSDFKRCLDDQNYLVSALIHRQHGQFTLVAVPKDVRPHLQKLWSEHPVVLIGEALDPEKSATTYRQRMGLGELTCLQFPSDYQDELQVWIPPRNKELPFYEWGTQVIEILALQAKGPVVILLQDYSLRKRISAALAAQFGSRVSLDKISGTQRSVTLCDWSFWDKDLPPSFAPEILVVLSLPFPDLQVPLVTAKVEQMKREKKDWFRSYLLPEAVGHLKRGVGRIRESKGLVTVLDPRIHNPNYGYTILESLAPYIKTTRSLES
jgi:ATP-dependent DNA helicase DinG